MTDNSVPPEGRQEWLGPGSRVAQYVIEQRVGSGGMAVVFSARDELLGRTVALKVLSPSLAHDEEFRRRFLRESRSVAAVEESHIVPVYAAGESDGVLYLATRFVSGGDLGSLLRRGGGPFAPDRAVSLISQVASALDAAHRAGLVHRDVKPGNVLIDSTPGRPEHAYLADFGLSKVASSATGLTASGMFLGTPDYCAPEQITGKPPVSARSDQYSLACVAFCLLTGSVPFAREETMAALFAHVQDPVPSLAALRPGLSPAVDAVMGRAMAKDPAVRFPSCGEFAAALEAAVRSPAQAPAWDPAAGPAQPVAPAAGPAWGPPAWAAPAPGQPLYQTPPAPQPQLPVTTPLAGQPGSQNWSPGTIPPGRGPGPRKGTIALIIAAVAAVVLLGGGFGVAAALDKAHTTTLPPAPTLSLTPSSTPYQSPSTPAPTAASVQSQFTGTWTGTYTCAQGLTGMRLDITAGANGQATAIFNFYAVSSNPSVPSGEFTMTGTYSANGISLNPGHWIKQPANYEMAGLNAGPLVNDGGTLTGVVTNSACTTFTANKAS